MTKIIAEVKRTNGNIETVDLSEKFTSMNNVLFNKIKEGTKKQGGGDILKVTYTVLLSNLPQLKKNYNDLNNEGFDGYMPNDEYFMNLPAFKTNEKTQFFS